jgi:dienelactone hydrolase
VSILAACTRNSAATTLYLATILTTTASPQAPAPPESLRTTSEQVATFETSVAPRPDEDIAEACRYEVTVTTPSRRIKGVWVIFERSLGTLQYYRDADVRAFARRHDLALLFPFHCRSKADSGGDINVDPRRGLGRTLFVALDQLAERSGHPELASAKLILLGFSGTGSLVARMTEYAPDRVIASIPTHPGHFDPLGMDTITLLSRAAAIPQLILVGSADAVSGTQRPYDYFRRHFDKGAPWTFVVQNQVPHCCIMNAKALMLEWLDAVVVRTLTRATGRYGFIAMEPTDATGCPGQTAPVRTSLCLGPKDTWDGQNWSVSSALVEKRMVARQGMMPAGWLPTDAFAQHWKSFVTESQHSVTMPP